MKNIKLLPIALLSISFFLLTPSPAEASFFDNLINGIKNITNKKTTNEKTNGEITVSSNITLIPEEDLNKNGQIDAGDGIRFQYTVKNTSSNKYSFLTLKTNIDQNMISFVRNTFGISGVREKDNSLEIPHIRIGPNQEKTLSFDADVKLFTLEDKTITTEPELIDSSAKLLKKSEKKQISVKKVDKTLLERGTNINKKALNN